MAKYLASLRSLHVGGGILWILSAAVVAVAAATRFAEPTALMLAMVTAAVWLRNSHWCVLVVVVPALYVPAPAMGPIAGISAVTIVGVIALIGGAITLVLSKQIDVLKARPLAPAAICACGALAGGSLHSDIRTGIGMLALWILGSAIGSAAAARPLVLKAITVALIPGALLALGEVIGLRNFWLNLTHGTKYVGTWKPIDSLHRAFGPFGHPVVCGAVLATFAVLAYTQRSTKYFRLLSVLYALAALASLSMTAVMALLAGGTSFLLTSPARSRRILGSALGVALFVGLAVAVATVQSGANASSLASDTGRVASLHIIETDFGHHPLSLLLPGGYSGAGRYLDSIGGNLATGLVNANVFDNQWITSTYNFGIIFLILIAVIIASATLRLPPRDRAVTLPPLVAISAALLFFDGLYWTSTSFVVFVCIGLLLGRSEQWRLATASAVDLPKAGLLSSREPHATER